MSVRDGSRYLCETTFVDSELRAFVYLICHPSRSVQVLVSHELLRATPLSAVKGAVGIDESEQEALVHRPHKQGLS